MNKLLSKINIKYGTKYRIDTLRKARNNPDGVSKKLSKRLEGVTGIPRLRFLYPDEYGNPWEEIV